MNILLWVLQVIFAFHTALGGAWKFSNPAASAPSLQMIPQSVWLMLGVFELLCAIGFILPVFDKSKGKMAPIAATCIAIEMLLFSGLHLMSGQTEHGPMIYWLVVAPICAFIAYGRFVLKPIKPN